jgi:hypothetical protein
MSDSKPLDPATADVTPDPQAQTSDRELTDADLSQVSGGFGQEAVESKAKTADKAHKAMTDYLHS